MRKGPVYREFSFFAAAMIFCKICGRYRLSSNARYGGGELHSVSQQISCWSSAGPAPERKPGRHLRPEAFGCSRSRRSRSEDQGGYGLTLPDLIVRLLGVFYLNRRYVASRCAT
jgi:hypothetical protein